MNTHIEVREMSGKIINLNCINLLNIKAIKVIEN